MERLTWERYKTTNDIIIIDLHNGFSAIAIKSWDKKNRQYEVDFWLTMGDTDQWELINTDRQFIFQTNYKYINSAILKVTATLLSDGFFDHTIELMKYKEECFCIGTEVYIENRKKRNDGGIG